MKIVKKDLNQILNLWTLCQALGDTLLATVVKKISHSNKYKIDKSIMNQLILQTFKYKINQDLKKIGQNNCLKNLFIGLESIHIITS